MGGCKMKWNGAHTDIVGWRRPTAYEMRQGFGAIHYREFHISEWLKPDGTIKRWIKADDGLRYYR
jgi:hypothetical protein